MRIICKDLTYSYDPKKKPAVYALNKVSLTINEGEFFGIIGQTGSGKSTLIQHLNALLPVQEGFLSVGEFDLSLKDKKKYKKQLKQLRSKVGMVFQYPEYQLFAESVFDDVAFGLKNFFPNLNANEVAQRVASALNAVGLNYYEVKDKSPFDLSGGQKRRVAIAGVLVTDPEVLVLDEPVAGLDPAGKKELMALLHSLENGRRTIIIVSHDMDEVLENCSRIAVMQQGELVKIGTPEEVFNSNQSYAGLNLPVTVQVNNLLKERGINLNCNFKTEQFICDLERFFKKTTNN